MTNRMINVTREEYGKYIRGNTLTDKPVESISMSVMQSVNSKGQLMAQAVYPKSVPGTPVRPYYEIRKVQS